MGGTMVAIIEGVAVGTAVLMIFHFLVAIYARSVRREALEKEFDEGGQPGDRDAFIAAGMKDYAHSWRRRALFLIYLIPVVAVLFIIFVVNRS